MTSERCLKTICAVLALAAALALAAGCSTPHSDVSDRMASIVVTNRSTNDINLAIHAVFEKHDYEEGRSDDDEVVFQKKASFMSGVIYSDWYSGGVWERVKIYQRERDPGETVVECDGYMVSEPEDPLFSEVRHEHNSKRKHLQSLMDEVAADLKTRPPGTNAAPVTTNAPPATAVPATTNPPPPAK